VNERAIRSLVSRVKTLSESLSPNDPELPPEPRECTKLNSLAEAIRHALLDHQVRSPKSIFLVETNICLDFVATGHLQWRLSADHEPRPLSVPPFVATCEWGNMDRHPLEKMCNTADTGYRSGNGLAGTGKSTIAQAFTEIGSADGKLGANFFCLRDVEDKGNLQASLAFGMAISTSWSWNSLPS